METAATGAAVALDVRADTAGLGRTRFYREAVQAAKDLGIPQISFRKALAEARAESVVLDDLIGQLMQAAPDPAAMEMPTLEPLISTDRAYPRPEASIAALHSVVRQFTRSSPLLIAIDNLHLAGMTMRRAVVALFSELVDDAGCGLAIVVTTAANLTTGPFVGGPAALHVLRSLEPPEVEEVARKVVPALGRDGIEAVAALSQGNPHWLKEILAHVAAVEGSDVDLASAVRRYDPSVWGTEILALLSAEAALVVEALAVLGSVEPLAPQELAAVLELSEEAVGQALREVNQYVEEQYGRWNLNHGLLREAVLREVEPWKASQWHIRALPFASPLASAMHVKSAKAGAVQDEVRLLRAGARDSEIETCIDLLETALDRADRSVGCEIARDLARLYVFETGDLSKALDVLDDRRPEPREDPDGFADWHILRFKAKSAQRRPDMYALGAELREATKQVPASAKQAHLRLLAERAGNAWMSAPERATVRAQLAAAPLPPRGATADDARLLLAAAEHVAVEGGPAVSESPRRQTVLSLLKRCIDGDGLWSSIALEPETVCQVQWLLLCCDADSELERFEQQADARLRRASPSAHALHRVLVAHRLIGAGELDKAHDCVIEALPRIVSPRRGLAIGIGVDALVELGLVEDAEAMLAKAGSGPGTETVSDWRLALAHARVDRNLLRIGSSIERLAWVGKERPLERRRSPAFAWRVDLLRMLHRFRYPRHPDSQKWLDLMKPALPGAADNPELVANRLLAEELSHTRSWGTAVPRARAERVAGEVWAGRDLQEAREHRERAVSLLGSHDGSASGPARLEYARAVYELARQYRDEARVAKSGAAELRQRAVELAARAGSMAFDFGAAQLWLAAWDVHSTAGRKRPTMAPAPGVQMPPFVSPDAALVAELAATGVTRAEVIALSGLSVHSVDKHRAALKNKLVKNLPSGGPRVIPRIAGQPTRAHARREDWLLFRRAQYEAFRKMRADASASDPQTEDR